MEPFERLAAALGRLPGVGRRSAERMAERLARERDGLAAELLEALEAVRRGVRCCSLCGSITAAERDPCRLCASETRDRRLLCVVEDPSDIAALERSGSFTGRYHALMGRISPLRGDGPDELRVQALLRRVQEEGIREVVLALSTDVEGDATSSYLAERLKRAGVKVTHLAYGLPVGSGVRYADALTLARAMKGRQEL